jgi:Cytochrome P460
MLRTKKPVLLALAILLSAAVCAQNPAPASSGPEYTADSQLKFPEHYREWIYLTTGFDMSYNPAAQMAVVETGTWPDKTVLVLEPRDAEGKGSINQKGNYQGTGTMGLEVHVKDDARFPTKWAFFGFGDGKIAKMVPLSANCYTCHAAHAAVDTTFVQFYPTLLPIAKSKGTLSSSYQREAQTPAGK